MSLSQPFNPKVHPQAGVFDPNVFEGSLMDPTENPEQANQIVRELTSPDVPLMPSLPSDKMFLPGGYVDQDGELHQEAHIREINGADEEAMARELRNPNVSVAKVVDLLLKRCVLEVGPHRATPQILGEMLAGDRASMMLAIRVLTFGSDWEVEEFPCRLCGKNFGTVVELDSIGEKRMDNPRVQEIDVRLRNNHTATVALLDGASQMAMIGDGNRTGPEEISIAIDRCLKRYDGKPVPLNGIAQTLSMADRRAISTAMSEAQPGPKMEEVMVTCTECGQEASYSISLLDLFR